MVSKKEKGYQCDDCQLIYHTAQEATRCEEWCLEHGTCNLERTKNHIRTNDTPNK